MSRARAISAIAGGGSVACTAVTAGKIVRALDGVGERLDDQRAPLLVVLAAVPREVDLREQHVVVAGVAQQREAARDRRARQSSIAQQSSGFSGSV